MIIRFRCDVPMSEKKGILRYCDKKCRNCLCALAMDEWGREEHVSLDQECANFTLRNLKKMSGRDHE